MIFESQLCALRKPSISIKNQLSFTKELSNFQCEIKELEEKLEISEKNLTKLLEKNNKKQAEILETQSQLKNLEEDLKLSQENLKQTKEDALLIKKAQFILVSQNQSFQKNTENSTNLLEKTMIKLKLLKDQYINLQSENQKLVSERQNLVVRASISFEELTPRPNIYAFLKKACCDEEKKEEFLKEIHKKSSTREIFEVLFEKAFAFKAVKRVLKQKMTIDIAKSSREKKMSIKSSLIHRIRNSEQMNEIEDFSKK